MNIQTKQCQNCQKEFRIEPEDFEFYEKIKVPTPTFCPECRLLRKMLWRNERNLYKRKCNLCNSDMISIYNKNVSFPVYCQKCWWSDKWDSMRYGQNYDFSKTFFEQWKKLYLQIPKISLVNINPVNSEYVHDAINNKNSYFVFLGDYNENVMHSTVSFNNKDSVDCYAMNDSNCCYENFYCDKNFKVFFGFHSKGCYNCEFIYNCRNCSDCLGCINLRNQKYHIFNKSYTRENYQKKVQELNLSSYYNFVKFKNKYLQFISFFIRRCSYIEKSYNVSGDNIQNSNNCSQCFDVLSDIEHPCGAEDSKFLFLFGYGVKECFDCFVGGYNNSLVYDSFNIAFASNVKFSSWLLDGAFNVNYSDHCLGQSSNLFGCVGLRHKQYCILNKQYTKEEYEELVPKIIKQMNEMPYVSRKSEIRNPKFETNSNVQNSKLKEKEIVYKYGEFFPPELSPFCYNETTAQEYFPLTKEQVLEKGYLWKDPEARNIKIDIKTEDLPDNIKDVGDDIIGQIIQCANCKLQIPNSKEIQNSLTSDNNKFSTNHNLQTTNCFSNCTTAFKIIPQELEFYRKMNLPLPRLCPNCRHYQRIKQRNPLKLWHRKCMCAGIKSSNEIYQNTATHFHGTEPCPNEFETTYAPDRPEIVYCEECYLAEVA